MKRLPFVLLVLLAACPGRSPDFECRGDGNCRAGFACVDGACLHRCGSDAGSCPDAGTCSAFDSSVCDDGGACAADAGTAVDGGEPAGYCSP